jgi:hypothetical protein
VTKRENKEEITRLFMTTSEAIHHHFSKAEIRLYLLKAGISKNMWTYFETTN